MKNANIIREVKLAARHKYAWPGGYPLEVIMSDGETLCVDCAKSEFPRIGRATRDGDRGGWAAVGVQVHWEGPADICCNCNAEIESAYGDAP